MKRVFNFFKEHPLMALMALVCAVLMFVDQDSAVIMAIAGTAMPVNGGTNGVAGGDTVHTPENGQPQASNGIAGEATQLGGQATTVSNVAEASDIIEPDIDEDIVQIASDESVIDTIKRKVKRKVRVNSFEVDHYLIDEKPAVVTLAEEVAGGTTVVLKFDEGENLMEPYYTASVIGVKGADGEVDIMLICVDKDASGNPIVKAVNGEKTNTTDSFGKVPAIAKGAKIALLASAAYETQKFIAPSTVVPTPERMYLQKQLCNRIVSDYFESQKKRVPFKDAVIAEAILRQFRLESCRTAWIGAKGKVKVKALNPSLGDQFDYTSLGLRWQFKRKYDLKPVEGKFGFAQIIDLAMDKFTGFGSSKTATFILGKKLLAAIQKIDFSMHKDITMTEGTAWGVKATKLVTVFGTINLVHDPMLDHLGMEWQGGLIDDDGLVRYYMKNEDNKTEAVEGEEAKRQIVMTIDCICLKGYSHVWVDGSQLEDAA